MHKRIFSLVLVLALAVLSAGCAQDVPGGAVGRIKTSDGWVPDVLNSGRHTCYGYDTMYLMEITSSSFTERLNILVGGKVNLAVDLTVRTRANTGDKERIKKAFENVPSVPSQDKKSYWITIENMYKNFLRMKVLAIPRTLFEIQPDVQTAIANSPKIAEAVRRQIAEAAQSTPLIVEDVQITNYDWPETITKAQEELVKIQLKEAAAAAQVRADLEKAKGMLKVAEAEKLVDFKRAESIAGSIDIIRKKLAGSPEYLMWHQVKVMGEAANGPNNTFVFYPYATDMNQVRGMINNAQLQMLQKKK